MPGTDQPANTSTPTQIVRRTLRRSSSAGTHCVGSLLSTTKSARLPGARVPTALSRPPERAACAVYISSASPTVTPCPSFSRSPFAVLRSTAQRIPRSGSKSTTGASLLPLPGHTLWLDLPYETIRLLAEKGKAPSLGGFAPLSDKILTNVDFPVLDKQRACLLPALELYVEISNPEQPVSLAGSALRQSLQSLARAPFRVRPAVYTSMWGGHHLVSQVAAMRDFPRCWTARTGRAQWW